MPGNKFAASIASAAVGAMIALLISIYCAAGIHKQFGHLPLSSDDSYIYTGYVKMVFTPNAGWFSYNLGEHSAGTTGILFYYVLTATYAVTKFFIAPGPGALELNTWLVSATCFVLTGAIIGLFTARIGKHLGASPMATCLATIVAMTVFCISDKSVWGTFNGLENPLTALLVAALYLVVSDDDSLCSRAVPILSAALVATRPDWAAIVIMFPLAPIFRPAVARDFGELSRAAVRPCPPEKKWVNRPRYVFQNMLIFVTLTLLLVMPMGIISGNWQPTAHGARAHIQIPHSFNELANNTKKIFMTFWGASVPICWILAIVCHVFGKFGRTVYYLPASLTAFLLMRAVTGLVNLDVRDRYVSYLWVAIAMLAGASVLAMVSLPQLRFTAKIRIYALFIIFGCVAYSGWLGLQQGLFNLWADTREMQQVSVEPSLWMRDHLPAGSVIAMEPAGAIRTFTDFTLVDRIGLTTPHFTKFGRDFGKSPYDTYMNFLQVNKVDYVFDYPSKFGGLGAFQSLHCWEPSPRVHSLGKICVVAIK